MVSRFKDSYDIQHEILVSQAVPIYIWVTRKAFPSWRLFGKALVLRIVRLQILRPLFVNRPELEEIPKRVQELVKQEFTENLQLDLAWQLV